MTFYMHAYVDAELAESHGRQVVEITRQGSEFTVLLHPEFPIDQREPKWFANLPASRKSHAEHHQKQQPKLPLQQQPQPAAPGKGSTAALIPCVEAEAATKPCRPQRAAAAAAVSRACATLNPPQRGAAAMRS
jgi:hypothetical protein